MVGLTLQPIAHELLDPQQIEVATNVLREEETQRTHLVVYLSGAHAYGFPSPDSDLDLKAIHVVPTADLVGLDAVRTTFDRAEIIDGVEIDYTSNELGHVLTSMLGGNGNFLERVLGRCALVESTWLAELRPIAARSLSRRVHRHYRGFATSQLQALVKDPTVKKLLYVLRTALTGLHLLAAGEVETDLSRIMARYGYADAQELIVRKRAGERVAVDPAILEAWRPRLDVLFERLDAAHASSVLPEEPPNEAEVRAWLIGVRRAAFG